MEKCQRVVGTIWMLEQVCCCEERRQCVGGMWDMLDLLGNCVVLSGFVSGKEGKRWRLGLSDFIKKKWYGVG